MENYIKIKKKIFLGQMLWRSDKDSKLRDIDDKLFPYPKEGKRWALKDDFIKRLQFIQSLIEDKLPNNQIYHLKENIRGCLLCEKKDNSTKLFFLDKYAWDISMTHYIKIHNIKPTDNFIDFIFNIDINKYFKINLIARNFKNEKNITYLKLEKNQIMVLDALMKHGGYTKRYYDKENNNLSRYSEHAGLLENKNNRVHDIIVSGNTIRVDKGDEEIFLPGNIPKAFEYNYIFHTHPPTPKPGGRVNDGILYEFPSLGDIFHFIDHYNIGSTIGSLIMTSEGMYNIRKLMFDSDKIKIDENKMYKEIRTEIWKMNKKAIDNYGTQFTSYKFYSKIAQNHEYIDSINDKLNKYMLHIDFYSRVQDYKGRWIVDTLYLPLYEK
jgi:hypothetical protein